MKLYFSKIHTERGVFVFNPALKLEVSYELDSWVVNGLPYSVGPRCCPVQNNFSYFIGRHLYLAYFMHPPLINCHYWETMFGLVLIA